MPQPAKEQGSSGGDTSNQNQSSEIKQSDDSKPTKEEANDDDAAEPKKEQKDRTIRKPIPSGGQPLTSSPELDKQTVSYKLPSRHSTTVPSLRVTY